MTFVIDPTRETISPASTVANTVDHAASSVHRAIDKASGVIHPGVDQVASGAHNALNTLTGAASKAAETLEERGGQLREAQSRLVASCCAQVRERPLSSIGIAVAGGFLLSWLLRHR